MTKFAFLLSALIILLIQACTLSARQEEHLNAQLGKYIQSYNDGRLLELIALTHPAVVKHYHAMGDTLFIQHFKGENLDGKTYFSNPTYREMKTKGKHIQRKYTVEHYNPVEELNPQYVLFAVSEDGGDNWFFIFGEDYENPHIHHFKRLFD